ncbi:TonB-dependent receptor [Luteibacter rhizovicinus]|uniref:TonB-dependent receptor n=1 Tax=Luteibacter rhizovicinus TaxID=242606 RepID=A0A4R3YKU8_9GAMM|nr:TonB-dependent receptor [Luteibacter rhizovicinus]TCV92772.1 TonB-dependent receptor [Luteibacter rhizovicinus]
MSHRRTLLAASIIAGLCCFTGNVLAQDAAPAPAKPQTTQEKADAAKAAQLEGITVTGIRASLEKSLDTKRNADAVVEAVTAEDIGKFPNTNVAEAMTQVPGVTIDRAFGQGDRVSIDGTDPSLNLTFLNGQPISQTPWQYGAQPNRGFDFTMLAPEIVGRMEIYKSPEARLPEGSLGGTILLHTLQPLDLPANTIRGSFGLSYNDQASAGSRPNGSVLYSWKNADNTFGIIGSAQHFEEKIDRQGFEIFSYSPVSKWASSPAVAAGIANGTLNPNDKVPDEVNSAWFQQKRKRDSATLGIQLRPTSNWDIDFNSLFVRENFDNWNQSLYPFTGATPGNVTSFTPGPNGVITGGHVCGNDSANCPDIAQNTFDSNIRKSVVRTSAFDLKTTYRGEGWSLGGAAGYSKAVNNSISQAVMEPVYAGGYTWDINRGFAFDNPSAARNPANWHMGDVPGLGGWPGNYGNYSAKARDTYAQLDFTKDFDTFVNQVLVGYRFNRHEEGMQAHVYGGNAPTNMAALGFGGYTDTLGAFDSLPGSASHVMPDKDAQYAWVRATNGGNEDAGTYLNGTYKLVEKTNAAYAQANFAGGGFHGNVGIRYVHTVTDGSGFNYSGAPVLPAPAGSWQTSSTTQKNWLPSLNVAYDLTEDVILRFAAAKVIARPPYNMQVNNLFLNDSVLTGSGGNPNLNPYKSKNFSLAGEWYFAPQSYLALTGFYKKIDNYTFVDSAPERQFNSGIFNDKETFARQVAQGLCTPDGFCTYSISRPRDTGSGKVRGGSLSYQQSFWDTGFGVTASYTYAKGTLDSGGALPYNSKNSYSISPYYEMGPFSARISYNWRSAYLSGGYISGAPPATTDAYADLGATLGYKLNDAISFTLSGMNLTNETYFQYLQTKDLPVAKYTTGRRYMAAVHFAL